MKKAISVFLVLVMCLGALPAFAESVSEDVLISVKTRVDIPGELNKFEYGESSYDNVIRYEFTWHDENHEKEIYVTSDSLGRIVNYNRYENIDYSSDRSLIAFTMHDAEKMADAFVKKAYHEYFENEEDKLMLDNESKSSSYSGRYKTFVFVYDRYYKDEIMVANRVVVRVRATKDKIYVQSASASLDEKVEFVSGVAVKTDEDKYVENFPIKLTYMSDYSGEEKVVGLFYSMGKGFVSRITGDMVTQKHFDRYAEYGAEDSVMMESMATGGANNKNNALTPEEIKALEEMDGLVKVKDVEKKLRNIEILGITDDMKIDSTSTNKYDEKYTVRFTLKGDKKVTNVTYRGETGEITNIYTYFTNIERSVEEGITSDSGSVMPKVTIEAFVRELSGSKIDETKVLYTENGEKEKYGTLNATRQVNGVEYPENSINVTYNMTESIVTRYSVSWDEEVSAFPKVEEAIGYEKAMEAIFEIAPLYDAFVKTEDGYTPSVTVEKAVTINAVTGKEMYAYEDEKAEYTDIDTHWAEKAITVLWEHDIYLKGDKFKPDEAISQADMVSLFSACRDSGIIPLGWTKEKITAYAFEQGYVKADEPDKLMTRREAFEVLAEILGYGDIAGFDIYKSSYTDMEENGSAEILKAMGVLNGDTARPDDYLTRAEAAVMVYRYLK